MTYTDNTLMSVENAEAWIARLKTAKKGKCFLWDTNDCACCLGVKAEIEGVWDDETDWVGTRTVDGRAMFPAEKRLNAWGIPELVAYRLAILNDRSDTFTPVIDEIRRLFIAEREETAANYGWTA